MAEKTTDTATQENPPQENPQQEDPQQEDPPPEPIQIHGDLPISGEESIIVETKFETIEGAKSIHGASFLLQCPAR